AVVLPISLPVSLCPSLCVIRRGDLDQSSPARTADQLAPARGPAARARAREKRPLVAVSVHHDPVARQILEPAEHGVEQRPRGTAAPPRDDQVETDVLALREVFDERLQRIAGSG